jgi:ADP-ribose pyrophosphatase
VPAESIVTRTLHEGDHLTLLERNGWEFAQRNHGVGVVAIIAVTDEGELLLVEQHRLPTGCAVIELPAGLVADDLQETLLEAAARELMEETGFRAERIEPLISGPTSAGLTDECVALVRAQGVRRVSAGGGVDDEEIQVHLVALGSLSTWLAERERDGVLVDLKVRLAPALLENEPCAG